MQREDPGVNAAKKEDHLFEERTDLTGVFASAFLRVTALPLIGGDVVAGNVVGSCTNGAWADAVVSTTGGELGGSLSFRVLAGDAGGEVSSAVFLFERTLRRSCFFGDAGELGLLQNTQGMEIPSEKETQQRTSTYSAPRQRRCGVHQRSASTWEMARQLLPIVGIRTTSFRPAGLLLSWSARYKSK